MEGTVKEYLEGLKFGEIQSHKHVAVVPVIGASVSGADYLTMKEAMENHLLTVSEVSEGGNVPELKVRNNADKPVLMLDGEELAGAKQNRVLNTTILLREKSETIIPVSCTEHGRWSYNTTYFEESGHMIPAGIRSVQTMSVGNNLKQGGLYQSDQGAVWEGIECMARENKVDTPTGAMRDILEAKQEDLDEFLEHFPLMAGQNGLLVMVNGKVIGLDLVSRVAAFEKLYDKLIRSYVMDALTQKPAKGRVASRKKAVGFLEEIIQCGENSFDSVGYGHDYRYEGKKIVGSALVHNRSLIHAAFFQVTGTEKAGRMSPASRRRDYRVY